MTTGLNDGILSAHYPFFPDWQAGLLHPAAPVTSLIVPDNEPAPVSSAEVI